LCERGIKKSQGFLTKFIFPCNATLFIVFHTVLTKWFKRTNQRQPFSLQKLNMLIIGKTLVRSKLCKPSALKHDLYHKTSNLLVAGQAAVWCLQIIKTAKQC